MKTLLRLAALLLTWGALGQTAAWAQATAKDQSAQILNPNDGRTTLLQPLAVSAGTVTGYTITGPLPTAGQGALFVNGTQVTALPRTVALADADNIEFDPAPTFFGTYFFTFTAQGSGGVNTPASYGISVSDAACSVASPLNLFARANESWEGPTYPSITVSGTTLTASAFTQAASANNTTNLGVLDDLTMPGKALTWEADYSTESTTANASSITFTFSRPVKNFSITVGDLDVGSITATNPWIDELTVQGFPTTASTTPYTLTNTEYALGPNNDNAYSGNNVFTGTGENAAGSPDLAGANLIITFAQPVQKVTLTYRNTTTTAAANNPAKQVLTFPAMSWCAEADVTTTLAGPGNLSAGVQSGNYTATFTNNGPDVAPATTRTVSIPANRASAVNGGANGTVTGSQAAGWTITFPAGTDVASGAAGAVSYTFSLTPALTTTGQTIPVTSTTSTTTDEGANTAANTATVTYTVGAVADVTTTVTAPATLSAGVVSGNYTATFTNNGPSTATSTTRTVSIPANTASAVSGGANGTVTGSQAAGWTITFPAGANVASGAAVSYNFTLTPLPVANVVVTSNTTTPTSQGLNTAPDSDTETTPVTPIADVTTTLTGPATLTAGAVSGTYTATYANNGPSVAAATTRTVSIPVNQASAVSAPAGTVTGNEASGFTITFPAGTNVASGNSVSYPFTITPAGAATSVAVTSNTTTTTSQGANAAPDAATLTRTVTPIADVTTTLTGPGALTTGVVSGNYTVTFANNGPSPSAGTTRTVSIPANTASAVASSAGGTVTGSQATGWTITYPGGTFASGNSANYTFTLTPAPAVTSIAVTSNTTTTTSQGADAAPNSATVTQAVTLIALSGTVFEDVNYSGGVGRNLANSLTANTAFGTTIQRPAVTVELYDAAGNFLATTVTDGTGLYSFNVPAPADYTVRVVSGTVTSVRPRVAGNTDALVPVQTFVQGNTGRVGGEAPEKQDALANTGSQTLAQLTTGTGATATTAQSILTVTVPAAGQNNRNFGFNFDVVNNSRDAGQGSLRQFLLNSNALANTNLAQTGLTAGTETSIFMIPTGAATAGLRAGLVSGLTDLTPADGTVNNRVAVITPLSALPAITDSNTRVDGTEQTTNVGNTNNVTLGTGGTVGVTPTALGQLNGPEVQIVGTPGQTGSDFGLTVAANNTTITGLAIYGFGNTAANTGGGNLYVTTGATSGTLLTGNVIGSAAAAFADPGAATRSTGHGIYLQAGTDATTLFSGTISNNLIGYNSTGGVEMIVNANGNGTTTGYFVEGNEIRGNALGNNASDGIRLGINGGVVRNNLLAANQGPGVDLAGSAGNALITNNTVSNNGLNGAGQTSGIRLQGSANTISQNIISSNYGAGILAQNATTTSVFTRNSISGNGTILTATGGAASGQLGIDLLTAGDNASQGSGTYVSVNATGKTAASGANGLRNFPVVSQAAVTNITNGNLVISGYAPAGSTIELFVADRTTSAFGQGQTYLLSLTEGGTLNDITDADNKTSSYSGSFNGLNHGSETNANRFYYTIPLTSLTAPQRAALTAPGARLTATATSGGATSEFSGNLPVSQNAPLPVTLTSFTAQAAGQDTKLAWATAQELNNDHFVVERSFDGQAFTAISQVKGQGTKTTATTYAALDAQAAAKAQGRVVYYRLRQVDTDGTESLSSVQTVSFPASARTAVQVYPNPATSSADARLDLSGAAQGTYQVTITDMTGRTVRTLSRQGGTNDLLEVTSLPTGSYLVHLQGNSQVITRRLIKE